jgi:hypothetical protein
MGLEQNIKLKTALQELGCSALAFSSLAAPPITSKRYSQQQISQLIAGTKEFPDDREAAEFLQVTEAMKHLQEIVTPKIPVDWSNVLGVKDVLIQTFEKRRNDLDPLENRCWFVRLSVHNFFQGLRTDDSIVGTLNYYADEAAAFVSYELASEVSKRLNQRGVANKVEILTCRRRQSTITTSLEEIGFTQ